MSQAIRRTRAGLKDPKRPSGSFIFLGPSGVGKTETAKTLAEFLFGDESAMIQLDMSEYMEKHTVSRLVGSPPGYVGYDEGGQLTEAVRRKPFSVVLFDEIEKAHPDVFNTLLQILEDGRLTDAQGRTVDFKNTVIIMTSNLGTADLRKANVGFVKTDEAVTYEKMKDKVHEELKRHFRPEFLNRIDEIIVFHELSTEEITEIVDLLIKRVKDQLESQGLGFELTQPAKVLLANKGYDPALGARPLRRAIQRMVEDPLSEKILWKEFHAGDTIVVDVEDDEIVFRSIEGVEPPPVELAGSGTPNKHVARNRRDPQGRGPCRSRRFGRALTVSYPLRSADNESWCSKLTSSVRARRAACCVRRLQGRCRRQRDVARGRHRHGVETRHHARPRGRRPGRRPTAHAGDRASRSTTCAPRAGRCRRGSGHDDGGAALRLTHEYSGERGARPASSTELVGPTALHRGRAADRASGDCCAVGTSCRWRPTCAALGTGVQQDPELVAALPGAAGSTSPTLDAQLQAELRDSPDDAGDARGPRRARRETVQVVARRVARQADGRALEVRVRPPHVVR